MTLKRKPLLIILATLIIGFFTGFITHGLITRAKIQNFVRIGTHEGFIGRYLQIIEPDEQQLQHIEPILEDYAERFRQHLSSSRQIMKELHFKMVEEMKPFLQDEQIRRLQESIKRFEHPKPYRQHKRLPPSERPCRSGRKNIMSDTLE